MTGHFLYLQERTQRILSTARMSPDARSRALGNAPNPIAAKEHRIVVDIKADTRTVETIDHVERMRARPRDLRARRIRGPKTEILDAVAKAFNVTLYELLDIARPKGISHPRFAAALLLRSRQKLSFPQIARALKRKNHTSALNAVREGAFLLATDPEWAERYHAAERLLTDAK